MTFPGTKPARRVHVPPAPSGTLPDPGGRTPAERAYWIPRRPGDPLPRRHLCPTRSERRRDRCAGIPDPGGKPDSSHPKQGLEVFR